MTVLLIEHDMKLVMSISDHIVVINQGAPLADGTPEQIRDNPDVIKAYLGEDVYKRQGGYSPRRALTSPLNLLLRKVKDAWKCMAFSA